MYALTAIKGCGRRYANICCKKAEINLDKRAGELVSFMGQIFCYFLWCKDDDDELFLIMMIFNIYLEVVSDFTQSRDVYFFWLLLYS